MQYHINNKVLGKLSLSRFNSLSDRSIIEQLQDIQMPMSEEDSLKS